MRAAACLTQALFALNSRYFISDKRVMQTLATFSVLPPGYVQQIERILACPGQTSADLCASVAQLESAWRDVAALAGGAYRPQFVLPEE
jgi:hypothetical protein